MTDLPERSLSRRPAVRNAALWVLALFSGALALLGTWVILDRLPGMERVLDDGTATTAEVYGGQSWVLVGAVVLGTGIVGLALALAVAARGAARGTDPDRAVSAEPTALAETVPAEDPSVARPSGDTDTDTGTDTDTDTDEELPALAR